jgi:FixJ family two-component response regulator
MTRLSDAACPTLVCVIDDDAAVRQSLDNLLRSSGFAVKTFARPCEFLADKGRAQAACLILDIQLKGANGLDFQQELQDGDAGPPVILVSGHGDIAMTVRGMKAGAITFLAKPCDDRQMIEAVEEAVSLDETRKQARRKRDGLRGLYATLSRRERQVMGLVTAGLLNKQVAARLGLSEITVKIHRGNLMRKMGVPSLAELVMQADTLGVREANAARFMS